jgi:hypothetical protein
MFFLKTRKYSAGAFYLCIAAVISGLAMAALPAMLIPCTCFQLLAPQIGDAPIEKLEPLGHLLERLGAGAQRAFSE